MIPFDEELGASLKAGDFVAIGEPGYRQRDPVVKWVGPVEKAWKLEVLVGGKRWRRRTGRPTGYKHNPWSRSIPLEILGLVTPEEAEAWRKEKTLAEAETKERLALLLELRHLSECSLESSALGKWPIESIRALQGCLDELTSQRA